MTTAIAVAAVLACVALGSLIKQVDGATLRRWRLSRRWDVSRLAREFIKAADEPLATLRGLKHMINSWERGVRRPSERYWLLYLRIFPEFLVGESANSGLEESGDVQSLAETVRALEQQVAGLSRRLDELSRDEHSESQPRETAGRGKTRTGHIRWTRTPLLTVLLPALGA